MCLIYVALSNLEGGEIYNAPPTYHRNGRERLF